MDKFITPKEASLILNVSTITLRRWSNKGKIKFIKPNGVTRRYDISTIIDTKEKEKKRKKIIYCRVSSPGQKNDLERQIQQII